MSVDGEVVLRIRTRRVLKLRIWAGICCIRFGLWVMGSVAEAADG